MGVNRRRLDRGATLVEFALAFPVLVMLMLGIVDAGINFGNKVQTSHAAREGARAGMVNRVGSVTGCWMDPDGTLQPSTRALVCLTKARTHMDPERVRVKAFYMGPNGKATTTVSNPSNSIVVCVMSEAYSVTGMFNWALGGRAHTSRAVTKTAKPYGGQYTAPGGELPLPGHDWSWCAPDDPVGTE